MVRSGYWFRRLDPTTLWCALALLVLPAVVIAIDPTYLYTPPGTLDPWVYAGYHLHLHAMWEFSPWGYYGTRVPYTVVGYVLYRLFGTEPSLYALVALQIYVATFSLFYTIRLLFGSPLGGFVAACALATNFWFLWAIGWGYVDGALIASVLFSFAALTAAARARAWRTAVLVWGASMAATVALYFMYVVLLPVEIIAFAVLAWFGSRRPPFLTTALLAGGIIGGLLFMGLANWAFGGNFDFLHPTFEQLGDLGSAAVKAAYYAPWRFWIWIATWLLFPAFAYVAAWAILFVRAPKLLANLRSEPSPQTSHDAALVALAVSCILAVSGFAFMQHMHVVVLSVWYHENVLLPFAFLVIGACFAVGLQNVRSATGRAAVGATACLLGVGQWVGVMLGVIKVPLPSVFPPAGVNPNSLLLPGAALLSGPILEPLWIAAGAAILVAAVVTRHWLVPIVAVAFLSFVSVVSIPDVAIAPHFYSSSVRDQSLTIYDVARFIDGEREDRPLAFWWDDKDPSRALFLSLGEMYIWNPFVTPTVTPDDRVVIITSGTNITQIERGLSASRGLALSRITEARFQRGDVRLDVAIANVSLELQSKERLPNHLVPPSSVKPLTIPLAAFGGSRRPGPLYVRTPPGAWEYAAVARIPPSTSQPGGKNAYLHVRLHVTSGVVGVGATTSDGSTFLNRVFYAIDSNPRDVYIPIPRFQDASQIVICNGDQVAPSDVTIFSVNFIYR